LRFNHLVDGDRTGVSDHTVMNARRLSQALAIAGAVAFLSIAAWPGPASARHPTRTFSVWGDYEEPATQVDGVWCRGLASAELANCGARVTGVSYFTGPLYGTQHYELDGGATPDGRLWYEGVGHFVDGGITGCGKGDFDVFEWDGWVDMKRFDPATRSAPGFNRWRIIRDTATGQLRERIVAGEGVNHWTVYFDKAGTPRDFGRGRFTGTVTCVR
jgi:hypothetical protein